MSDYEIVGRIAYQQSVEKSKLPEPGRAPKAPPEFENTHQKNVWELNVLLREIFGWSQMQTVRGSYYEEALEKFAKTLYLEGYKEGVRQAEKVRFEASRAETNAAMRGLFGALLNKPIDNEED